MSTDTAPDTTDEGTPKKKRSKKKLLVLLVLVAAIGAAVWFLVLSPGEAKAEAPKPGEVVTLEPIQVNLASGHYLRIGIALQLTETAHEVDGSKALDATIELFSGREMAEVTRPKDRDELKDELEEELAHRYHDEVMEVYFTEFVTQ